MNRPLTTALPLALVMIGVACAWELRQLVITLAAAAVISGAAQPLLRPLRRRGLGTASALTVWGVVAFAITLLLTATVGRALIVEAHTAADALSVAHQRWLSTWSTHLLGAQAAHLHPGGIAVWVLDTGGTAVALLAQLGWALLMAVLWTMHRERMVRTGLRLLPPARRPEVRTAVRLLERRLGKTVLGEGARFLLTTVVLFGALSLLGVNFPALSALVAAMAGLVPLVGPLCGAAIVAGAALSQGPAVAIAAGGAVLVTAIALGMGARRVHAWHRPHAVLTLALVVVLSRVIGIGALLLATPIAAAIEVLIGWALACHARAVVPSTLEEVHVATIRLSDRLRERTHGGGELGTLAARLLAVMETTAGPPSRSTGADRRSCAA